ncbi:MAG: hypothetical protein LBR54_03705, partial [Oscillospiraceae bacterium]|nr:hypothetical protein [Oscillospiraceae bacterium]
MQNIIIFDFGRGKNNQLITKQIREQGVYCELWDMKSHSISEAKLINPLGAIVLGTADPQELQTLGVPVLELPDGLASKLVLKNFLFDKCGCTGEWNMAQYSEKLIEEIRETVGDGKALLALSGGVDSS